MFSKFLNGLAGLGISAAAAALSSTLVKSELLPEQLKWLGAAGTIVAACVIAIAYAFRDSFSHKAIRFVLCLLVAMFCACVLWIRAARITKVELGGTVRNYLRGGTLTDSGRNAEKQCNSDSAEQLIQCSGVAAIPNLYGNSYWSVYYLEICAYLLLLVTFVLLTCSLQLQDP